MIIYWIFFQNQIKGIPLKVPPNFVIFKASAILLYGVRATDGLEGIMRSSNGNKEALRLGMMLVAT